MKTLTEAGVRRSKIITDVSHVIKFVLKPSLFLHFYPSAMLSSVFIQIILNFGGNY